MSSSGMPSTFVRVRPLPPAAPMSPAGTIHQDLDPRRAPPRCPLFHLLHAGLVRRCCRAWWWWCAPAERGDGPLPPRQGLRALVVFGRGVPSSGRAARQCAPKLRQPVRRIGVAEHPRPDPVHEGDLALQISVHAVLSHHPQGAHVGGAAPYHVEFVTNQRAILAALPRGTVVRRPAAKRVCAGAGREGRPREPAAGCGRIALPPFRGSTGARAGLPAHRAPAAAGSTAWWPGPARPPFRPRGTAPVADGRSVPGESRPSVGCHPVVLQMHVADERAPRPRRKSSGASATGKGVCRYRARSAPAGPSPLAKLPPIRGW